jgi:hypothetical protein
MRQHRKAGQRPPDARMPPQAHHQFPPERPQPRQNRSRPWACGKATQPWPQRKHQGHWGLPARCTQTRWARPGPTTAATPTAECRPAWPGRVTCRHQGERGPLAQAGRCSSTGHVPARCQCTPGSGPAPCENCTAARPSPPPAHWRPCWRVQFKRPKPPAASSTDQFHKGLNPCRACPRPPAARTGAEQQHQGGHHQHHRQGAGAHGEARAGAIEKDHNKHLEPRTEPYTPHTTLKAPTTRRGTPSCLHHHRAPCKGPKPGR